MEGLKINTEPVEPGELKAFFVGGKGFALPEGAVNCTALNLNEIDAYLSNCGNVGGQMNLLNPNSPLIGQSSDSRVISEKRREEFAKRARGCIDGTCIFAGKVANCWRVVDIPESPLDEVLNP